MADHLAAVEGDPVEGGVGELVDVVPAELLRQEVVHARQATQLRQLRGIPESIRQPERLAPLAEVALEEALPVQELAHQRLTAGHVGVVLHPAAADRVEPAFLDLGLDAVEHIRVVLLQPLVLLGL